MAESEDGSDPLRDRIMNVALALAEEDAGWYDLRLHRVARRVGVPLAAVLARFWDTDAIADAWFARALHAMLQEPEPGFGTRPPSGCLHAMFTRGPSGAPSGGRRHDRGEIAPVAPAPLGADGVQPLAPNPLGVRCGVARHPWPATAGGGSWPYPRVPRGAAGMAERL